MCSYEGSSAFPTLSLVSSILHMASYLPCFEVAREFSPDTGVMLLGLPRHQTHESNIRVFLIVSLRYFAIATQNEDSELG